MPRVEPKLYGYEQREFDPSLLDSPRVKGLRFLATLQPRTPLYVLERHDQRIPPQKPPPPDYPRWAGVWSIDAGSLDEALGLAGIDDQLENTRTAATVIGPQLVSEYLPFLIAFREIIESDLGDEEVLAAIDRLRLNSRWAHFVEKHGGAEKLLFHSGEPRRSKQ